MKTLLAFLLLITSLAAFSQARPDSTQTEITKQLPEMPDSLKASWNKVDSVRHSFNLEADSIQTSYNNSIRTLTESEAKIRNKIDSLTALNLPAGVHFEKLDSLNQKRHEAKQNLDAKLSSLKTKTIGKLDQIEMTPGMEGPVGAFTEKVNSFSINDHQFNAIPPVEVLGFRTPTALGSIPSGRNFSKIANLETSFGNLGQVADQVGTISEEIGTLAEGNMINVSAIPGAIEAQASNVEGFNQLNNASESLSEISSLNNPDELKSKGVEIVAEQAIDHFAGNEEALKSAMDVVNTYKEKYSSVSSLKDLAKRPPNPMKGKPFIERLLPGVYFQVIRHGVWLLDVNPYIGYHISGKFTAGAGWNQRWAYESNAGLWVREKTIFGPRAYVDFSFGKSYAIHLETEYMNTFVPNNIIVSRNEGSRKWVSSTMVGLKKTYRVYKNLGGTVLIQYNLYDRHFQSPYMDRINARMGFEYTLKKKVKPRKEETSPVQETD